MEEGIRFCLNTIKKINDLEKVLRDLDKIGFINRADYESFIKMVYKMKAYFDYRLIKEKEFYKELKNKGDSSLGVRPTRIR